jgi:hypothetical protein
MLILFLQGGKDGKKQNCTSRRIAWLGRTAKEDFNRFTKRLCWYCRPKRA